jgi:DNA-binding transcriptional LysR family regulator
MDYNDLALFTRVVERGSFTAAAHAAQLPKSSVTRSIARLEHELGVRLIQRTTRQRGVTEAGRELYERVRNAVGALEEATAAVRDHGRDPRGVVRVTAPVDVTMMGLSEAIAQRLARYPSIHVEMVLTSRVVDLVAEGIDLGVRAGQLADSSLVARKVGTMHAGLYASKAYLDRRGRPRRVADLGGHDGVLFRGRAGRATWVLEGPTREDAIDIAGRVSSDDFAFALTAIEAGLGIGPLPMVVGASRAPAVERVLPRHRFAGSPLHVVMPSASFVPARVAIVRDFLVEYLTGLLGSDRLG